MPSVPKKYRKKETRAEKARRYRRNQAKKQVARIRKGKPYRDHIHQRDQEMCQLCGYVKGSIPGKWLEVHHIDKRHGSREHDPRNQVLLCKSIGQENCHDKVEERKKHYRPILQGIVDRKYKRRQDESKDHR